MERLYFKIFDELQKTRYYTKESIKELLKEEKVRIKYENEKKDICETLTITNNELDKNEFIKIINGGLYLIIELYTTKTSCIVNAKNQRTWSFNSVCIQDCAIKI